MSDFEDSLLPATAPALSKALDVLEERLFGLPVHMISKDPWTVDVALLDHLAWEQSVDVWNFDWPEDVKRRVVAASAEVHRFKGTPFSIKTALAAFDVDTEFLEWWEPDGVAEGMEAGSFRVTAYAGRSLYGATENSIDNQMLQAMTSVVQRVAPVSRRLLFRLGERFDTEVFARTQVRTACVSEYEMDPDPRPLKSVFDLGVATSHRALRVSKYSHDVLRRQ